MAYEHLAQTLWRFSWKWLTGREALGDRELVNSCAALFSNDYGIWGEGGPNPGEPVRITPDYVRRLLDSDASHIVCALSGEELIGYAVVLQFKATDGRRVAWIAQLVVAKQYRQSRVATTLLFSAWQFSDYQVWGLITASPYAVRALETATRRPCRGKAIIEERRSLVQDLKRYLDYLPDDVIVNDSGPEPRIDTSFYLDHSDLDAMRERAARKDRPWNLGMINQGQEWFAATFQSQAPSVARGEYLSELLEGLDAIWIRAYEGMTLSSDHAWHRYGQDEARWVLELTDPPPDSVILDAGCGDGRHVRTLAALGYHVIGVDISRRLIERAEAETAGQRDLIQFRISDLREPDVLEAEAFTLALCLYDVIGSSSDPFDDKRILANLRHCLKPNGVLVLSVMNALSVLPLLQQDHRPESEEEFVRALEALPVSRAMEMTGAVFDPAAIVYFGGRYYRKEQFDAAPDLPPSELIVRDRRFVASELAELVKSSGFEIVDLFGVKAGRWSERLDPEAPDARELLLVARRT